MKINFLITALAAIVPLFMGFIWYNPKVFGKAWMKEVGMDPKNPPTPNPIIFLWSYLLAFVVALILNVIVIHQWGVFSVLAHDPALVDPNSEIYAFFTDFMAKYGSNGRHFGHGALHGFITGLLLVLPIFGSNAIFEKKSAKLVFINGLYWTVVMALMGGIISQFG